MINAINNNTSFKGVNLYFIRKNSKQGKLILEAAKDPLLKGQIKALEKHGMNLDVVRNYDHESKPTKFVNLWMDGTKRPPTRNGLNPIQGVYGEIKTIDDAKLLLAKGITKAIEFSKEHFKLLANTRTHARKLTVSAEETRRTLGIDPNKMKITKLLRKNNQQNNTQNINC